MLAGLAEAAPGHVEIVRSLVVDALTDERLRHVAEVSRIVARADRPREATPLSRLAGGRGSAADGAAPRSRVDLPSSSEGTPTPTGH